MQKLSLKRNVAQMRAKRVENVPSSFSIRSFLHGFACATFLSYFGFFFYFASSGPNLPIIDTSRLMASFPPSDLMKQSTESVAPVITTHSVQDQLAPPGSSTTAPLSKLVVSDWDVIGAQKAEPLPGGPFTSKNLVLGIAVNVDAKNFAIFAHSFRKVSPSGEAIVFMNAPVPERHRRIAATARVRIISFDTATLQPAFIRAYHPSSLRWILFERLLRVNNNAIQKAFGKVIMVDVRDTVFQSDPFSLIQNAGSAMSVFAEAAGSTIGMCGWNTAWVKDCFGERIFTDIQAKPIICSGISMGSMDGVLEYVTKMSAVLLGQHELSSSFPACERNGVDQGVHNVLVHTGALKNVTIQYEYDFPVVNLQAYPQLLVNQLDPSVLLSDTSVQYAIVHQYDRLSALQSALAVKYVHWVDMSDPQAEWAKEPACAAYSVTYNKDLFRGKCELASQRVMSAASCCEVCQGKNKPVPAMAAGKAATSDYPVEAVCSAFAYTEGVCYMKTCRQSEVLASLNDPNQAFYAQPGAVSAHLSFAQG